jgi:CRISPR-associated exonuclease Cas4
MSADDFLPISALQHLLFCERQFALIHVDGLWAENRLTVEGRILHRRVDEGGGLSRPGVRIARGLELVSDRIGLVGKADVVEFPRSRDASGSAHPFPIEYKRGRPKTNRCDEVQLCAQALCLEEMLARSVPRGALFYKRINRRVEVEFDEALRDLTERAVARAREILALGRVPRVARASKCKRCSLVNLCLPKATGPRTSARAYVLSTLSIDGIAP